MPEERAKYTLDPLDRFYEFWRKVEIQEHGCWLWTGCRHASGHGQTMYMIEGRRVQSPARVAWEVLNGCKIPDGYELHHRCLNPPCVNPAHTEPVTSKRHKAIHRAIKLKATTLSINCVTVEGGKNTFWEMEQPSATLEVQDL